MLTNKNFIARFGRSVHYKEFIFVLSVFLLAYVRAKSIPITTICFILTYFTEE